MQSRHYAPINVNIKFRYYYFLNISTTFPQRLVFVIYIMPLILLILNNYYYYTQSIYYIYN